MGEADDDEDIGDELHARLVELFLPLAPVLQNLSGAHWDFMFDVIESNLEVGIILFGWPF
jgi:E3 ubiquitin-protein ligase listerin